MQGASEVATACLRAQHASNVGIFLLSGTHGQETQAGIYRMTVQVPQNGANVLFSPTNSNIPSNTTIQPSEVLYFLEPESFKVRPTNKSGWNYGIRRAPMPNNVSIDAIFMRVSTNLYNAQPRHSAYAFGFNSGIFNNG